MPEPVREIFERHELRLVQPGVAAPQTGVATVLFATLVLARFKGGCEDKCGCDPLPLAYASGLDLPSLNTEHVNMGRMDRMGMVNGSTMHVVRVLAARTPCTRRVALALECAEY